MKGLRSIRSCVSVAANTNLRCDREAHDGVDDETHWHQLNESERLVWESFDPWASQRRETHRTALTQEN